eukprot:1161859-Pelagomonas_calceolata.AAC.11
MRHQGSVLLPHDETRLMKPLISTSTQRHSWHAWCFGVPGSTAGAMVHCGCFGVQGCTAGAMVHYGCFDVQGTPAPVHSSKTPKGKWRAW